MNGINNIHDHLKRGWLANQVHNFRAWFMDTFFTPVIVSKCEHEWRLEGTKIYRHGKMKFTTTYHKCKKCKTTRKTNFKY